MTKDTDEFLQFAEPVTCRECTFLRDDKLTEPKGWIQGNTKIGPVLEFPTSYQHGKHGVASRIESVNKDNSHSWVRISHGQNKLVTELIDREYDDDEQGTPATKTEVFAFASRSKAKAKPRRPSTACSFSRTVPILERLWIDIEQGAQFDQAYPVAKRINTLLRHGNLPREEDKMAGGGGNKKRFQYCTDSSGQGILYLRALQGHSGRNHIDLSLQDNVLIPNHFFEYIYHIGCAVNLHSITKFRTDNGRTKF